MTNILKINYPEWNATKQEYEYKSVNLLPYADISGMALTSWTAGQQAYNGRNVFPPRFQEVTENISIDITGYDQDDVLLELKQFYQAATAIAEYWLLLNPIIPPPYIQVKSDKEANSRYAVIIDRPNLTSLGKIIETPFYNLNSAILENLTLNLVRLTWRFNIPGEGSLLALSSLFNWSYTNPTVASYPQTAGETLFKVSSSGTLLTGDGGGFEIIYRSTNNGDTAFTQVYIGNPGDSVDDFVEAANGDIFATRLGSDELLKSVDDGATWNSFGTFNAPSGFYRDELDRLWLVGFNSISFQAEVYYSDDDGATWNNITPSPLIGAQSTTPLYIIKIPGTNTLYIGTDNVGLLRSTDNAITWEYYNIPEPNDGSINRLYLDNENNVIVCYDGSAIAVTTDNGVSWNLYETPGSDHVTNIIQVDGTYYITLTLGSSGSLYKSTNFVYWAAVDDTGTSQGAIALTDDNALLYDDGPSNMTKYSLDTITQLGVDSNTDENVISNKNVFSNITHLKWHDTSGGIFTDLFPAVAFPYDLVATTPISNGDALYFISDTSVDRTGSFSNIVFNISARFLTPTTFVAWEWEYFNGSWTTLQVLDQTVEFQKLGLLVVSFEIPSDWVTTSIDGVTGYMIRAEYATNVTPLQVQSQAVRDVYFSQHSYVTIPEIAGDLESISKLTIKNLSDNDGRDGSIPDLYSNRVIVGKRKLSKGSGFSAYLNPVTLSGDTGQNHPDVTVDYGTNVASLADVQSPVAEKARYNPAGVEAMSNRVTWNLNGILGLEYTGDFHVYARVQRTAGNITDFDVQLKVVYGSGGLEFTTDSVQVQTTTKFELLDLGTITVPQFDSLTDTLQFIIQASAASGTPNLDIFDLILIPVDEWAGDFIDSANVSGSEISQNESLEANGLEPLEVPIVVKNTSGAIKSQYETSGPALYIEPLPDDTQRLWFLQAQASTTGDDFSWIAKPEICSLVTIEHNPGYMGFIK